MLTEDWIIGFMWAQGTQTESHFIVRYKNEPDILATIAQSLGILNRPFQPAYGRWALKININQPIVQRLLDLGWSGRKDTDRAYMQGVFDESEFVRGYCYSKHTYDRPVRRRRKGGTYQAHRLRVYGSFDVLAHIDAFFQRECGTLPKKRVKHSTKIEGKYTGTTYVLYYQGKREVEAILYFLGKLSPKTHGK